MQHWRSTLLLPVSAVALILAGCDSSSTSSSETAKTASTAEMKEAGAPAPLPLSRKYDVKSGIVRFKVTDFSGGRNEVVYFDNYGSRECIEILDEEGNVSERRFCDGEKMYIVNKYTPADTVIIMGENHRYGTEMKFDDAPPPERQREKYKWEPAPAMTVAGRECSAYKMDSGYGLAIFAGWSHITLYHKQESQFGTILRQAESVEVDVEVPAEKFTVPAGAKLQKM